MKPVADLVTLHAMDAGLNATPPTIPVSVVRCRLADGEKVEFVVFPRNAAWVPFSGVFIFAYFEAGQWLPVFVGEAEDLSRALPNHQRWREAERAGATHVLARLVFGAMSRQELERRLIEYLRPPLNERRR